MSVIRNTFGAGRWFPAEPDVLRRMVRGFLDAAVVPPLSGRLVGLVAPHAGYIYSGEVAGYAYRALRDSGLADDSPTTVIVLGISHQNAFEGLALMDGDAISSPLGTTALDRDMADQMVAHSGAVRYDYAPHVGEHSAENQIPFIQEALPHAKLVVGLFGSHDAMTRAAVSATLAQISRPRGGGAVPSVERRVVVVASTDLLHDANYEKVSRLDSRTLDAMVSLDMGGLEHAWSWGEQVCCGLSPVLTLLQFAAHHGVTRGSVLRYRNSGDDHPESRGQWVVGYGAVAFTTP